MLCAAALLALAASAGADTRPRAREAGIVIGVHATGAANAITDVPGVRVGHATVHGESGHTGVTAILPPGEDRFHERVPAAISSATALGRARDRAGRYSPVR